MDEEVCDMSKILNQDKTKKMSKREERSRVAVSVRVMRSEKGLTVRDMAKHSKLSEQCIRNFESRKSPEKDFDDILAQILTVLRVKQADVLKYSESFAPRQNLNSL